MDQYFGTKMFKIQENITRITTGCRRRDSCTDLLKNVKVLPLHSQYILPFLLFMVNNKNKFKLNHVVYNIDTRQKYNLNSNLHQIYHYIKTGVYSTDIKVLKSPVMYK